MKTSDLILSAAALASCASAHVTLNPNFGAHASSYFKTTVKIPHGKAGYETTKIEITIPHGVLKATPEAIPGWKIDIKERDIPSYVSHGSTVNKGPHTITYEAKCIPDVNALCTNDDHPGLDNNHLMEIGLQLKFGCTFGQDVNFKATQDATVWKGMHTIWFPVKQWYSSPNTNNGNDKDDHLLQWTNTASEDGPWGPASPAPYIFLYSSDKCEQDSTGTATTKGMLFNGVIVNPAEDTEVVTTKAEVISVVEEEILLLKEDVISELEGEIDALMSAKKEIDVEAHSHNDVKAALAFGVVGAVMSVISMIGMIILYCTRVKLVYHPPAASMDTFVEHKD